MPVDLMKSTATMLALWPHLSLNHSVTLWLQASAIVLNPLYLSEMTDQASGVISAIAAHILLRGGLLRSYKYVYYKCCKYSQGIETTLELEPVTANMIEV